MHFTAIGDTRPAHGRARELPLSDAIDLVEAIVDQVDALHAKARIHRAITADSIDLTNAGNPTFAPRRNPRAIRW